MIAGLSLAMPFAVLTAHPGFGRWTARLGLCAVPDEVAPPETLRRLEGVALETGRHDSPPKKAA
jgi:membrane glycosyltransferase